MPSQPRGAAPCERSAHLPRGPEHWSSERFPPSAPPPPSQLNSVRPLRGAHPTPAVPSAAAGHSYVPPPLRGHGLPPPAPSHLRARPRPGPALCLPSRQAAPRRREPRRGLAPSRSSEAGRTSQGSAVGSLTSQPLTPDSVNESRTLSQSPSPGNLRRRDTEADAPEPGPEQTG